MVLVETEGSYTNESTMDYVDVRGGQSYSVLVTADQATSDYYMVATPKLLNITDMTKFGIGVLDYDNSTTAAGGPLPIGPDLFDLDFSIKPTQVLQVEPDYRDSKA
ncbi:hypothetical protein ABKV19_023677 [Rosa sericea]